MSVHQVFRYRFNRTTLLAVGLTTVLAGLLWARFGAVPNLNFVIAGFMLLPLLPAKKIPALLVMLIIGLNLGLWRGAVVKSQTDLYQPLYGQKVILVGRVIDDSSYAYKSQTEFHVGDVQLVARDGNVDLPGRVRIRGFGAPSVRRGDVVEVVGKIKEGYGNRQGSMSFAKITVYGRSANVIEDIRVKYFAGVYTALPEPNASLGLGFLVGLRTLLPEGLLDKLSATGLTHIVAVSGYNLTILVRFMRRIFARKSIYLAMLSSVSLIIAFLAVTGFTPSIVRAAVVSGLALTAWYYGRRVHPSMILLLSAAVTAFWNPLYLWYDLGWYLSFAAFFGVLVLAPLITARLFTKKPSNVAQVVIETTSAQVMAVPIIAVIFGEVSLISLFANALILPLIPVAMLLTFVAGLAGALVPYISGWFAWPADFLLTFMVDSINLMSRASWALKEVDTNWIQAGIFYGLISFVAIVMLKVTKKRLNAAEIVE